jgi:hypothetical protein
MKSKIFALIAVLSLAFVVGGCNQTDNTNTTANANLNANANARANSNTPVIASSTPEPTNANDNRRAPTREEYNRDKDRYNREAKENGRTVGSGVNDGWLWVKTRFDLAAADDLRDSTINVDVSNDVVTLTGTVASQAQVAKADQVAKAVDGVKSVKNMLKVAANNSNSNGNRNANANANRPKTK